MLANKIFKFDIRSRSALLWVAIIESNVAFPL